MPIAKGNLLQHKDLRGNSRDAERLTIGSRFNTIADLAITRRSLLGMPNSGGQL